MELLRNKRVYLLPATKKKTIHQLTDISASPIVMLTNVLESLGALSISMNKDLTYDIIVCRGYESYKRNRRHFKSDTDFLIFHWDNLIGGWFIDVYKKDMKVDDIVERKGPFIFEGKIKQK